jgi:hypothetical protein
MRFDDEQVFPGDLLMPAQFYVCPSGDFPVNVFSPRYWRMQSAVFKRTVAPVARGATSSFKRRKNGCLTAAALDSCHV